MKRQQSFLVAMLVASALAGAGATAAFASRSGAHMPAGGGTAGVPVIQTSLNSMSELQSAVTSTVRKVSPAGVTVRTQDGLGSGGIYDGSGLVLTHAHVGDRATSITVSLSDGS